LTGRKRKVASSDNKEKYTGETADECEIMSVQIKKKKGNEKESFSFERVEHWL